MRGFAIRLAICALSLWVASVIVPGVHIVGLGTLVVAALLLGFVNAVVRPILILLTIPLTIVTLGLFLLVINAATFGLVAALLPGFTVSGFFAALFGSIVVGLTGWIVSWNVGNEGRREAMVVRTRDRS
jgi:putative membrane protein